MKNDIPHLCEISQVAFAKFAILSLDMRRSVTMMQG